jgi:tetratricopeptide (TPR) repeat protein
MRYKKILLVIALIAAKTVSVQAQINTERMMDIGRNALYFEDYVLSIQYFNQVIGAKPYMADPWFYRAAAKLYLEDYKGSEEDCTKALERNSFLVRAYLCRSYARMSLKDYEGAIGDCEKGLEFDVENKTLMQNKAIAQLSLKKFKDAEKSLDDFIKKYSTDVAGYMIRGELNIDRGDTLAAVEDFSRAISVDRYYAPARAGRAYAYLQLENYGNALPDLDEAIRLDPDVPAYYINRGLARYNLNNLRGTLDDFDRVIRLDPNNELAWFNRGIIRQQVGDLNRAIEDFDKVIYLDPEHYTAIYNRALLRGQTGDLKGGIADLTKIIGEYPNFTPALYQRSEYKKKIGDLKGADKDYFAAWSLEDKVKAERAARQRNPQKYAVADSIKDAQKEKKRNMDRYNKVIIAENDDATKSKYQNPMRGRVQDKNVEVQMEDLFTITFYEQSRPGPSRRIMDYSNYLEILMEAGLKDYQKLLISNQELALSNDQANHHFKSIDDISSRISTSIGETSNKTTAALFFARGINFALVQDLNSALEDLSKAIENQPDFILAYFERANIRFRKINFEYSEKINDEDVTTKSNKGYKGFDNSSEPKNQSGISIGEKVFGTDYDLVMHDYDKILELNPKFIYAYFNRGYIRSMQRDYRNALIDFTKAIELNPDFAEAWFNRGITQIYLGDREHGIADLRMAGQLGLYKAYNLIKRYEN